MGFTLVELMVVIAIIGVAAGAVMLSMPDPRPTLAVEAERFAARLTLAREEAVGRGRRRRRSRPRRVRPYRRGRCRQRAAGTRWPIRHRRH